MPVIINDESPFTDGEGKIYKSGDNANKLKEYVSANPGMFMNGEQVLPYELFLYENGQFAICLGVFGTLWVISLVSFMICVLTTGTKFGERMIEQYCKEQGDTMGLRAKIENFFENAERVPEIWVDNDFFAGVYNSTVVFLPTSEIAWIYYQGNDEPITTGEEINRLAGLDKILKIHTRDRRSFEVRITGEGNADAVCGIIKQLYPHIMTGYSEENERRYKTIDW